MWIEISQIFACISSVIFTTLHKVPPKIIDYGQNFLPVIPSEIAHVACAGMVLAASYWGQDQYFYFQHVYAPAMFIKATLLPLTILPDSNPECTVWHPLKCLTRNDMLPSGHMLAACAASLCFESPLALAGAGGSDVRQDAATQSAILNALLPLQGPPLTFCAASASKLAFMKPWRKAFTLQELSEASKKDFEDDGYITSQDLMAIILQIIWTLGVLQDQFPGYQHNSLSTSVRLFEYGGARCYKVRDRDGSDKHVANGTAFYVRKLLPVPIIVTWRSSNCLVKHSDVPYRTEKSAPSRDLNDFLSTILDQVDIQQAPQYVPVQRMLSECTNYYMKIRRNFKPAYELQLRDQEDIFFDKIETGENVCVPQILALECPDGFSPLTSINKGEMTLCGKCPKSALDINGRAPPFEVAPEIIHNPGAADPWQCSNGEPIEKTDQMVSKYFNDFLFPIEITKNGYAVADGF